MNSIDSVKKIMTEFADAAGITGAEKKPPRRYLWTDAFAALDFIGPVYQSPIFLKISSTSS